MTGELVAAVTDKNPRFQRLVNDALALVHQAIEDGIPPSRVVAALMVAAAFPAKAFKPEGSTDDVMKNTLKIMVERTYDDMTIELVVDPNFHTEGGRA